jgi:hypothetical protein
MSYHEDDYTPNVYAVTIPMVTHVTLKVYGPPDMNTDDLVDEALIAWKRGDDALSTGVPLPDYDGTHVEVLEDNNPEQAIDDDPIERDAYGETS